MLITRTRFPGRPANAKAPFGNQDAVGDRQFRRPVTVEDELRLDRPRAHFHGRCLRRRDKNSSSAWATTEEIVRSDPAACARTRATSRHRQLDREHRGRLRRLHRPARGGALDIPAGLTLRTPEPARQLTRRLRHRDTGLNQLGGRVDPLGVLTATSPATTSHAINILPSMSRTSRDTRRAFQPAVTQRHLKTEVATCVGGVISPLLLNVALHGLEEAAGVRYIPFGKHAGDTKTGSPVLIRYADDMIALCHSQQQAADVEARLAQWLAPRGLAFNEDKTRIVSLGAGFDFLGFNVRRYNSRKLLIKPSKAAIRRLRERLAAEMRTLRGGNAMAVIATLNPIIRGWAAYYRGVVSSKVFRTLDQYMWVLTYKWATWRHHNKSKYWVVGRYFGKFNKFRNDRWVFGDRDSGACLVKFSWTAIERHVPVKGTASPDDPALASYWAKRRRVRLPLDNYTLRLLARQAGCCPLCGDHLLTADQPPQSPEQWERWWLQVTRQAIATSYLTHDGKPGPGRDDQTRLVHASCQRALKARERRKPALQPAPSVRLA